MQAYLRRYRQHIGIFLAFLIGFGTAGLIMPGNVRAGFDLDDILEGAVKIGGVKLAVDEFGEEINDLINKVLDNNDASVDAATKVVPIISVIGNKHVGAAQIVGPSEAVDKVGAVAQLETSFMDKMFRIKAMVPVEGEDVNDINRVMGVAVSAVIDIKL